MDNMMRNDGAIGPYDDETIVISGMAAKLPESDGVYQLRDNLFNKIDMVTDDDRRWKKNNPEIPHRTGKVSDIDKFDVGFFGYSIRVAASIEPAVRLMIERAFESILDAGYHPEDLHGSNTAVIVGICALESTSHLHYGNIPRYVAYNLQLNGPNFVTDTACSTSLYALDAACKCLSQGLCDRAIVISGNLCLCPNTSLQFARLGVLSPDGRSKAFDDCADGYVRSEGAVAILVEKYKTARRMYAEIVHRKTNADGYKQQGITFPSTYAQKELLREVYDECKIDPRTVSYVEAHGTGTRIGDPEELSTLDYIYCTNRKDPLLIGSVKSNIGHNEPVSGLSSLVKIMIAMETGYIPPNLNYTKPKSGVEGLELGRMVVVTEKTPWPKGEALAAINNFGFGGANFHAVLRSNRKVKRTEGRPDDNLPRLVCFNGRTESSIAAFVEDFVSRPLDAEYVRLLHDISRQNIDGYRHRAYIVMDKRGSSITSSTKLPFVKKKLCFVFTNPERSWFNLCQQLMDVKIFEDAVNRIRSIVNKEIEMDKSDIINSMQAVNLNEVLGTLIFQIALVDVLKTIGVEPDLLIGLGVGEVVAAFFDNVLTLQQAVKTAFHFVLDPEKFAATLRRVIPQKQIRSKKWRPLNTIDGSNNSLTVNALKYFLYNVSNVAEIDQIINKVGRETVLITIGPNVKIESDLIREILPNSSEDILNDFFSSLGWLHLRGFDMNLHLLYPKVSYPVSRGTPMISPHVRWQYDRSLPSSVYIESTKKQAQFLDGHFSKSVSWSFLSGHVIDGRNLFPATGYLFIVWKHFAEMLGKYFEEVKIVFSNVKFVRALNLDKTDNIDLWTGITLETRRFEVTEDNEVLVHGFIEIASDDDEFLDLSIPELNNADAQMLTKDVYKEFRLRGYSYRGEFASLKQINLQGTRGDILWNNNWVAFADNMLQMGIIQNDTRNLRVPTGIQRMLVDPKRHFAKCEEFNNELPVVAPKDNNLISSGGIQIQGLGVATLQRRKVAEPVLECNKFVSNNASQSEADAVRCFIQLILENTRTTKFKSVEVVGAGSLISPHVQASLDDLPLIKPDIVVFTGKKLELPNAKVENSDLKSVNDAILVIISNGLKNKEIITKALDATKLSSGFVLTREDLQANYAEVTDEYAILCSARTDRETLILLRESSKLEERSELDLTNSLHDFKWISTLQEMVASNKSVILYAEHCNNNGILGLVNCLRQEVPGDKITCVLLMDEAPKFDQNDEFYKTQLMKNLTVNVWNDGQWGTYRHLKLDSAQTVESVHCYANITTNGDLSSLKWIENCLHRESHLEPHMELIHIYYSALNFRDIMLASGKISSDAVKNSESQPQQDCILGFEYSGRNSSGQRFVGMAPAGALSTMILASTNLLLPLPDGWSLEEGATVLIVYTTVLYAFIERGKLKRGKSILIHSGTGAIGQAAINVALHFGCTIFTTVGTSEKKEFIRKHFPQINDDHIGDSRSTSFEEMIHQRTNGNGVDFVLNSLAGEKLQASLRCLACKGVFLEIGKFDLANDVNTEITLLKKQATFHGIMLDQIYLQNDSRARRTIEYVADGIRKGYVKPLMRTVFENDEIEAAFRYMATGKHMGKVLIKIREEEDERICPPSLQRFRSMPRFLCKPNSTYIIVGGLGGFGLELANWLVMRGAKKLVLTTRTGVKSGYQSYRLRLFKKYGVKILIKMDDVATEGGCSDLLTVAEESGPVDGIFNLAVVLQDGLFENQTPDTFKMALIPKAYATEHLDVVSRRTSPNLRYFVIFSSVSCGRGNAGQTNYGMANSVMERICEQRKRDGYPALAIQWGAIGDVGLVAEMQERDTEMVIGGTLQQKISSCLNVLDKLLRQNEPIVSSMVVAEKRSGFSSGNIMDTVLHILGVPNVKSISLHTTFPELGMDSIMAVEIKQVLETDFDIILGPQDLRNLTLAKLKELVDDKNKLDEEDSNNTDKNINEILMRYIAPEKDANLPIIELQTGLEANERAIQVFCLPGIEGAAIIFNDLAKRFRFHATCLQFCCKDRFESIEEQAKSLTEVIGETPGDFVIVAYSFGCVLAVEMVHQLEERGKKGKLIFIDGAPDYIKKLTLKLMPFEDENTMQTVFLFWAISRYSRVDVNEEIREKLLKLETLKEKVEACSELGVTSEKEFSVTYLKDVVTSSYFKMKALQKYIPREYKLVSDILLCKPGRAIIADVADDYGLSKIFLQPVAIKILAGDHLTVLEDVELANVINDYVIDKKL